MSNINRIRLSGTTYNIQDSNATKTVELTQAQYDALATKDANTMYIITDATGQTVDLSNYYQKSETSGATEIASALASKVDDTDVFVTTTNRDSFTSTVEEAVYQLSTNDVYTINFKRTNANNSIEGTIYIGTDAYRYSGTSAADMVTTPSLDGKVGFTFDGVNVTIATLNRDTYHITELFLESWDGEDNEVPLYDVTVTHNPTIGQNKIDYLSHIYLEFVHDKYALATDLQGKQDALVSGTNIKTINNQSILGNGNITIGGGGSGGKTYEAGNNISITTGETADTINCTLPLSSDTNNNIFTSKSDINFFNNSNGCLALGGNHKISGGNRSTTFGFANSNFGNGLVCGFSNSGMTKYAYAIGDGSAANATSGQYNGLDGSDFAFTAGAHISGNGYTSVAMGWKTQTKNSTEVALCSNNISSKETNTYGDSGNTLFSIGNGVYNYSDANKHNAFEIRQNGDIYIADTNDTSTANYYEKPMIKLQDALAQGGGSSVTVDAALNLDSNNAVANSAITRALESKADVRLVEDNYLLASTIDDINPVSWSYDVTQTIVNDTDKIPSAKAVYDQLGGLRLVKITQADYDALETKDSNTLYVITTSTTN